MTTITYKFMKKGALFGRRILFCFSLRVAKKLDLMYNYSVVYTAKNKKEVLMKKRLTRILAMLLALVAILSALALPASANGTAEAGATREVDESRRLARVELGLLPVTNKRTAAYNKVTVLYNSRTVSTSALSIGGMTYLGFRAFAKAIGGSVTYNSGTRTSTMKYGSLSVTVSDGNYVIYANSRPIFSFSNSVIMSDGLMYVPIESLAKTVGLTVGTSDGKVTLSGTPKPLSATTPYSSDEVFWLARIIQAESSGESLLGKIGVGTVVMNRVASSHYPNTIYGVIFDRKYGVQFSPVLNGTIYNTPNYQSMLAARICLEGFRVSSDALFFLEPHLSTSSWIPSTRKYLFSILHHDFYA